MDPLSIRPLQSNDIQQCAAIMATTEPWITLGRTFDDCLAIVADENREVYVACDADRVAGFIIINMRGAFTGYIQTVCVDSAWRSHGLGSQLMQYAEDRIFSESPNAFLCVSSFNPRALQLYERLGYRVVGELGDYLITGQSEILMRKSIGPIDDYRCKKKRQDA
jgi:ribosomal protein S18 acetylase RimI-like enzyme